MKKDLHYIVHCLTHRALRQGLIQRKSICEKCGKSGTPQQIQAHHPDYNQPYFIKWLCAKCHYKEHGSPGYQKGQCGSYSLKKDVSF